jgi:5-methyltetrahydrofolate--homocysteine methyltransferase
MADFTHWRDFDLRPRQAKIERAFRLAGVTSPEEVPIIVNTPGYFAFAGTRVPEDYFTSPASMVAYQANGFEAHLAAVNDDTVPYFMPWFGTGVLASAFGCPIAIADGPGNDPAVVAPCVSSLKDVARLRLPDPARDGWMPRVLAAIDYARAESDLPVGLTDMQGPLDTLGLMCGQAQLYQWMYREPRMVHELFDLVTTAFIQWVKVQKQHIGEPFFRSNGLQGVWSPAGVGVWESDDDLVLIDSGLYGEFVAPYLDRIFATFGGGSVHFCGSGVHQLDNLLGIKHLRVINNSPLGKFDAFATLRAHTQGRVLLQIQDGTPLDIDDYYRHLFDRVDDFSGLMMATFVLDSMAMDREGGYEPVNWNPLDTANRVVAVVRECVRKRLAGEPLLTEAERMPLVAVAAAMPVEPEKHADLPLRQAASIEAIQRSLLDFDEEGIKTAVRAALETGLAPFEIVTLGLADGMAEVGRLYESGEFYLPELVLAGTTMAAAMTVLQPLLVDRSGGRGKGTIVLGTVQGDLHNIGKNIVGTLLEAAGFTVHDIGVDQSVTSFVRKARETGADIVAMSALLTTTLPHMARVIEALQEADLRSRVRVMVGGAPVSRTFADRIGAEGFAPDAVKAVREAERLMELGR